MQKINKFLFLFLYTLFTFGIQITHAEAPPFVTFESLVADYKISRVYSSNYGANGGTGTRLWVEGTQHGSKISFHISPEGAVYRWGGDSDLNDDLWICTLQGYSIADFERIKVMIEERTAAEQKGPEFIQLLAKEGALSTDWRKWFNAPDGVKIFWILLADEKWLHVRQVASKSDPKKIELKIARWSGGTYYDSDIVIGSFPLALAGKLDQFIGEAAAKVVAQRLALVKYFPALSYGGYTLAWAQSTNASWYFLWSRDHGFSYDLRKWSQAQEPTDLDSPYHTRQFTVLGSARDFIEAAIIDNKARLGGVAPKAPVLDYKPIAYLHLPSPASMTKTVLSRPGDEKNVAYYVAYRPFRDYFPLVGITKSNCLDFAKSWAANIELDKNILTTPVNGQGSFGFYSRPDSAYGYKTREDTLKAIDAYKNYFLSFAITSCTDYFRAKPVNNSKPPVDTFCPTVTASVHQNMKNSVKSQQESVDRVVATMKLFCPGGARADPANCQRVRNTYSFVFGELTRLQGLLYQMDRCPGRR